MQTTMERPESRPDRPERRSEARQGLARAAAVFVGLVVAFAALIWIAVTALTEPVQQMVAVGVASALLGGGLAFFQIELFAILRSRR
jgi:apolipoprotein N-acyltransferase